MLKERTAIIFTANTPHLAHANLMIDSLNDPGKGNFQGDLWVISTGLTDRAKNFLDYKNIKYLISNLSYAYEWKDWRKVAKSQPEYVLARKKNNESTSLRIAFEAYRNKRMSKLIILDWIEKFGDRYDYVALGDNDLYFQRDIHELFEMQYNVAPNQISYQEEVYSILPGSWLWNKDVHYSRYHDTSELDWGEREINIGFILSTPEVLKKVFEDVRKDFFCLNSELFVKHNWHDQDLVRLNRAKNPERYYSMSEGTIAHLCAGGEKFVEEVEPKKFLNIYTEEMPYVVHFAGGAWKKYPSISSTYSVNSELYYFSKECEPEYDKIRDNVIINLFNTNNKSFYSARKEEMKLNARDNWIENYYNGKKNVLLVGWFNVSTHNNMLKILEPFITSDVFNIGVVNGNALNAENESGCVIEEMPELLTTLTRIANDSNLVRTFGYKPVIDRTVYMDCFMAFKEEYNCTDRVCYALINLMYSYFKELLLFYKPDLLCIWSITNPLGKLLKKMSEQRGICYCGMEWGCLPGTIAFDFKGHMGASWVAQDYEFFNGLPIDGVDIENAKEYIAHALTGELSRNPNVEMSKDELAYFELLKRSGKKIILYVESNSAHSGNTLYSKDDRMVHSPFFYDDKDAYVELCKIVKTHPDWHIVYKPHPISLTRGLKVDIDFSCTSLLKSGSIESALEICDVSVSILSQSVYVSLLQKKPAIVLGRLQTNGCLAAKSLNDTNQIEELIIDSLNNGYTENDDMAFIEHVARLNKYYLFSYANLGIKKIDSMPRVINDLLYDKYEYYLTKEYEVLKERDSNYNYEEVKKPIVSVIIPVHNSKKYLPECLNSICGQSFEDIEIICVNNGSSDNSLEILEYYQRHDNRIKIFSQEEFPNASSPRNNGLKHATGKYVYFMDSDDTIASNALEECISVAENNDSDLVYFFFKEIRDNVQRTVIRPRYYSYLRFLPNEASYELKREYYKFFIQYPFPWAKLIRRELLIKNELLFDMDCRCFEDNPHNLQVLLSAKNPYVLNKKLYHLRIHRESTTQSVNPSIYGMVDAIDAMNKIYKRFNAYNEFQKWFVLYKTHLIGWAWDLVPENMKVDFFFDAKKLFVDGDELFLNEDSSWSYFEMPAPAYINRVNFILEKDDILEPWQRISKPHLYAIKVCEKLHLIKLAIKIKRFIKRV